MSRFFSDRGHKVHNLKREMEAGTRLQGWDEAAVEIFLEFLEVAVHSILHARRVYPPDIFERRRKYGVPVWMSRHPDLNSYIYQVLLRARSLMERGVVRKVLVCFFQGAEHVDQAPVERIAFDIRVNEDASVSADPASLQEIEDQLRGALLQIQKSSAYVPTRQGCTFALHVEAHEEEQDGVVGNDSAVNQDGGAASPVTLALRGGKWLIADTAARVVIAEPGRRRLVPIKSVRGRGLELDLSAEMGDCPD